MATIKRKKVTSRKVGVKKSSPVAEKKNSNNMPMVILAIVGLVVIVWNVVPAIFGKPGDIDLIKETSNFVQPRAVTLGEWFFNDANEIGVGKPWNVLGGASFKRSDAGVVSIINVTPGTRMVNRSLDFTVLPFRGQKKQFVVSVEVAVSEESKLKTSKAFAPVERDVEMKVQLLGPKMSPNEVVEADGDKLTKIAEKTIKVKANKPMSVQDFIFDAPLNRKVTMIRYYPVTNPAPALDKNKFVVGSATTRVDVDSIRVKEVTVGGPVDGGDTPVVKGRVSVEGVITKMGEKSYSINNASGKLIYALAGNFEYSEKAQINVAPQGSLLPYIPMEKFVGKTVKLTGDEQRGIVPGLTVMSLTAL